MSKITHEKAEINLQRLNSIASKFTATNYLRDILLTYISQQQKNDELLNEYRKRRMLQKELYECQNQNHKEMLLKLIDENLTNIDKLEAEML